MAKWEYCQLVSWAVWERPENPNDPWKDPVWHRALYSGETLVAEPIEAPSSTAGLNKLGAEGWEVINLTSSEFVYFDKNVNRNANSPLSMTYLLKREL